MYRLKAKNYFVFQRIFGIQINKEIQIVNQYNMDKRTLFYWSKLYSERLNEGQAFKIYRAS